MLPALLAPVLCAGVPLAQEGPPAAPPVEDPGASPSVAPAEPAPPVERVEALARRLVTAAYSGSPEAFGALLDRPRLLAPPEGTAPRADPAADPARRAALAEALDPWRTVGAVLEAGGDLAFVRAWEEDGAVLGLFRLSLLLEFDHQTWRFERRGDALVVVDVRVASRGESLAETLARRLAWDDATRALAAEAQRALAPGTPGGAPPPDGAAVPPERDLLERLDALPGAARDPELLARRAALAARVSPEAWSAVLAECEAARPDGTLADHLRLVHGRALEGPAVLRAALDRVEARTGDRALAEHHRGALDLEAGRWRAARRHFAQALMAQPGYEDPLWDLLAVHDATQQWDAFAAVLERLEERFGYSFDELGRDWPRFVASPAHARWRERREARER